MKRRYARNDEAALLPVSKQRLDLLNGEIRMYLSLKADPPVETVLEAARIKRTLEVEHVTRMSRVRLAVRKLVRK
jgi:hypothetical protein